MSGPGERADAPPIRHLRVLAVYYSQTGDSARVAEALCEPLEAAGHTVVREFVRPVPEYPFPWRNPLTFFNVLPECLLGPPPATNPVAFDSTGDFDLIILVYQVWFLSPSLPIQGFLASRAAAVLRGKSVISVSVSRNMWQSASERMKLLLRAAGAVQTDNVVITHQGPAWATFLTTPRMLLFGTKEPLWGIFPAAGIGAAELGRVRRFGELIRDRWPQRPPGSTEPVLRGAGAVAINSVYMIPEWIGWHLFVGWAYVLKALGAISRWLRMAGVVSFIFFLVCAVVLGIPVVIVSTLLLAPFLRRPIKAYAERLAAPSGTAIATKGSRTE